MIVTAVVYCSVLLVALTSVHDALALPYAGGNHNQWSRPGAMGGYQQPQQQQQRGYNHNNGGYNNGGYNNGGGYGGYNNNNFGQGGRPQWQQSGGYNGQGAEAYHTHVFNEPDRYGYDYTMPGATVHYLMYKKQGNRGPGGNFGNFGNFGVDSSGWNRNY